MIRLQITKSDGSIVVLKTFPDQSTCDSYIADEKLKPGWDNSWLVSTTDLVAASEALKAVTSQVAADQATRLNQIKAIVSATPGTLTNVQRDAILIHLVKQALGQ